MTVSSESEQKNALDACDEDDEDIEIIYERKPTREQAELAARLMLPPAFFCYKNVPGYISDDDNDGKILTVLKYSLVSVPCNCTCLKL